MVAVQPLSGDKAGGGGESAVSTGHFRHTGWLVPAWQLAGSGDHDSVRHSLTGASHEPTATP